MPDADAELIERVGQAPKAVAAFMERRAGCNHFFGEYPHDAERAAQIDQALRYLRCDRLLRDERRLRRTHRRDATVLRLLDDTVDMLAW